MEQFALTQSIAASCSAEDPANPTSSLGDPGWGSKESCGWLVGNYIIWTASNCVGKDGQYLPIVASPNEEVAGFCYNNPSGHNVIFMS